MIFILKSLIRWRKFIIAASLATAVVAAGISLILPAWYRATSSVFPPDTQTYVPSYVDLVSSLQFPVLGPTATGARPNTIYIDVLLSDRVGRQIVEEFDFKSIYKVGLMSDAIDKLHSHTMFTLLDNGLLKVSFEDRDRQRAADVTNRFIELLDQFNRELNITRAAKTKEFVAEQIEVHARELQRAEEELKDFQKEHQTLELSEQVRSSIGIISQLTAEAIGLEVELELLGQYQSTSSEAYIRKKRHYDEIRRQLQKLQGGSARSDDDPIPSVFPTFDEVPDVSLELARRIRDVQVEETVFEMLVQEHEKARIEEARDTPTVQVLDHATPPELRSRPKRKTIVVVGGLVGFGWSSVLALLITIFREDPERRRRLGDVMGPVVSDLRRITRKNK